jgi:hypothetical protein
MAENERVLLFDMVISGYGVKGATEPASRGAVCVFIC